LYLCPVLRKEDRAGDLRKVDVRGSAQAGSDL
jgi:hypothetical protein